jgi:hypothetical protein
VAICRTEESTRGKQHHILTVDKLHYYSHIIVVKHSPDWSLNRIASTCAHWASRSYPRPSDNTGSHQPARRRGSPLKERELQYTLRDPFHSPPGPHHIYVTLARTVDCWSLLAAVRPVHRYYREYRAIPAEQPAQISCIQQSQASVSPSDLGQAIEYLHAPRSSLNLVFCHLPISLDTVDPQPLQRTQHQSKYLCNRARRSEQRQ